MQKAGQGIGLTIIQSADLDSEMQEDILSAVLSTGDVDLLRRLLRHGESALSPVHAPTSQAWPQTPPQSMFSSVEHIVLRLNCEYALKLISSRVMGKVLWPAGHAMSLLLLERLTDNAVRQNLDVVRSTIGNSFADTIHRSRVFVEVGAGSGAPSLTASAMSNHHFTFVVATDFTEVGVQLLEANIQCNGSRARASYLDITDALSLCHLLDTICESGHYEVWICACDMSYDGTAIEALFSAAELVRRHSESRWQPQVWFARSSNFEHMDSHTHQCARAHHFSMRESLLIKAAGVQDSISPTYFSPCVDDTVAIFVFESNTSNHEHVLAQSASGQC